MTTINFNDELKALCLSFLQREKDVSVSLVVSCQKTGQTIVSTKNSDGIVLENSYGGEGEGIRLSDNISDEDLYNQISNLMDSPLAVLTLEEDVKWPED